MKVYYNSSLWSNAKGFSRIKQRTNWQFEYEGAKRYIPAIYRFSKGIVFDIITILDENRLYEFFNKYEAVEEKLTSQQRRLAKQEHPYQDVPVKEIWIDSKRVENSYSSSSDLSIPWAQQNDNLISLRKSYSSILKGTACFACERFCVPYPETHSAIQKILRFLRLAKVKGMKLSTYPVQSFYPLNINFEMSEQDNQRTVSFAHPITKLTHTLYFQNAKFVEIPMGSEKKRNLYYTLSWYEIDPALPEGDTLEFNSSIQYTEPLEDEFSPIATSSIGIIGGADGPTSVLFSKNGAEQNISLGLNGLPLYSCFSVPAFKKHESARFLLEGINIKKSDSKEYNFT